MDGHPGGGENRDAEAGWQQENARLWRFLRYGGMALVWPLGLVALVGRDWPRMTLAVIGGLFLVATVAYIVVSMVWTFRLHRRRWRMLRSEVSSVRSTGHHHDDEADGPTLGG